MPRGGGLAIGRARTGQGLFSTRAYRSGAVITRIFGKIVSPDLLWDVGGRFASNCFRFGPETYLDPAGEWGEYLNHACNPNAGIRKTNNRLFLFAVSSIGAGTEIRIDYSTILGDDDIWTMRCRCGHRSCRRTIRRFGSLPEPVQARYIEAGLVPTYVLNTLRPR